MLSTQDEFMDRGYVVLEQGLSSLEMMLLEKVSANLTEHAERLLQRMHSSEESATEFYRDHPEELIVVPEIDNALKVCRFEYIKGYNRSVREQIVPKLQQYIKQLTGDEFVLFKDKCNAKNPGGGAFKPHQDVIAYNHLKPNYHITVAIFLDESTVENGCLYFPKNYRDDLSDHHFPVQNTSGGALPILPSYEGGDRHGVIQQEVVNQIEWQAVLAQPGDVVIFDSYVPHYSEKNNSDHSRRAMFYTFNAQGYGDFYDEYYGMKHREFDHPSFHVATPTRHRKSKQ
ncbi:phytanoyl-CoA dioxygenase family protein [Aestuariirhabdus sp. Z084]|uniref:phytanoyl-CoA dioxygenase family protein n=1 Tax=Aestuariirhabdus haliotis TaxID=2918751 RepID=UPI00201B3B31|nr:phytanoyl-CoA dioxygenase family protein [Aestuariirhabdus haliotis]MCL6416940.1 phytanoyl-CoA dioxygenase family protein [Aestuariirhabdus haliotis]MCL6420957.1 phytanoyl-CoA dioxygenase family protein [Aestuariirhabdus haliotis]